MKITKDHVTRLASEAAFGKPLVTNNLRAIVVEAIVASVVDDRWQWCSADWAPYDFVHSDGTRLEVKQSAALQSWSAPGAPPSRSVFDIAPRKGYYHDAVKWISDPQRFADIYLFAHHPETVRDHADHRDPEQWNFYVIGAEELPPAPARTISLARIGKLIAPVTVSSLGDEIERIRSRGRSTA
jgi:hypothetical protein